jgi:hypothetical protein
MALIYLMHTVSLIHRISLGFERKCFGCQRRRAEHPCERDVDIVIVSYGSMAGEVSNCIQPSVTAVSPPAKYLLPTCRTRSILVAPRTRRPRTRDIRRVRIRGVMDGGH